MISVEYNVLWIGLLWASIVLFNLAVKWIAGLLMNTPAEPLGKAVINVAL